MSLVAVARDILMNFEISLEVFIPGEVRCADEQKQSVFS